MVAFTPAADSEVHLARAVIAIWPSGERHGYRSVAHAARELQLSKSSVRSACRAGRHPTGIFFKYSECKADPEGAPRPLGEDCPGSAPAAEQAGPSDLQFADLLTSITEDGQETGEVVWDILAAPVRGREEEIRLYCSQLSQESLITTIRVDNGAMNCDQLCAAAGTTFKDLIGAPAFREITRKVKQDGLDPSDPSHRGFYMRPFQAALICERMENQAVARFVKSIALQWASKRFNAALYSHFTQHPASVAARMKIRKVPEDADLVVIETSS